MDVLAKIFKILAILMWFIAGVLAFTQGVTLLNYIGCWICLMTFLIFRY